MAIMFLQPVRSPITLSFCRLNIPVFSKHSLCDTMSSPFTILVALCIRFHLSMSLYIERQTELNTGLQWASGQPALKWESSQQYPNSSSWLREPEVYLTIGLLITYHGLFPRTQWRHSRRGKSESLIIGGGSYTGTHY